MKKLGPARPWRIPFRAERALPAAVTGPSEREPLRREASDWSGVGKLGMERAPARTPDGLWREPRQTSRTTYLRGWPGLDDLGRRPAEMIARGQAVRIAQPTARSGSPCAGSGIPEA